MNNEFIETMDSLKLRFTSGNTCEVQSARITKEEFDIIQNEINKLLISVTAAHHNSWALENYRQEERDNFRGDGHW